MLWDNHAKAVSAYNIEAMPSSFVVDTRGVIRFVHSGFHATDPADWRKETDRTDDDPKISHYSTTNERLAAAAFFCGSVIMT